MTFFRSSVNSVNSLYSICRLFSLFSLYSLHRLHTVSAVNTLLKCSSYIISNTCSIANFQFIDFILAVGILFYILIAPGMVLGFRVSSFWLKIILTADRHIILEPVKQTNVNLDITFENQFYCICHVNGFQIV